MTEESKASLSKEERYDAVIALREAGKLEEALKEIKLLTDDYPDYPLARLALAVFYDKNGLPEASLEAAARACELDPENPFFYTALSALAVRSGRHKEAEEALAKAQEARFSAQLKRLREEHAQEKLKESQLQEEQKNEE